MPLSSKTTSVDPVSITVNNPTNTPSPIVGATSINTKAVNTTPVTMTTGTTSTAVHTSDITPVSASGVVYPSSDAASAAILELNQIAMMNQLHNMQLATTAQAGRAITAVIGVDTTTSATTPLLMNHAFTMPIMHTTPYGQLMASTAGVNTTAASATTPLMMNHAVTMPIVHIAQMDQLTTSVAGVNTTAATSATVPGLLPKGQTNTTTMFTQKAANIQTINGQTVTGQVINRQVVTGQVVTGQMVNGKVVGGQIVGGPAVGGTLQEQTARMPITGKRRALLIGIDYRNTQTQRQGKENI